MLKQKLQAEQIVSLKAKDTIRLDTIRFILAQINNKEINIQRQLTDEEIIQVIQKMRKELNESIESFTKGGRTDLIDESQKQLEIVSAFLPKEISDEELKKAIEKLVAENKDILQKNPKAIYGICLKELKSKAESSRITKIIQSIAIT